MVLKSGTYFKRVFKDGGWIIYKVVSLEKEQTHYKNIKVKSYRVIIIDHNPNRFGYAIEYNGQEVGGVIYRWDKISPYCVSDKIISKDKVMVEVL